MATVRDSYAQLQKRKEYLERELERRKDREEELLTFSERLSSANAELQTEKSSWEAKVGVRGGDRGEHNLVHSPFRMYMYSTCACIIMYM